MWGERESQLPTELVARALLTKIKQKRMPKEYKDRNDVVESTDDVVESTDDVVKSTNKVVESPARKEFLSLVERYKKQNPAKYETKKDELAKKLAAIK